MKAWAVLALTAAGCAWGLGFPLGKVALRELDPAHLVLLRFSVAAIASAPFAFAEAKARALFRSPVIWIAGMLYGAAFLLQFEGLARVSVTVAALLVGAMPALIAVCAQLMGERQSWVCWGGVAGATLGAILIAGRPDGASTPLGIALSLISQFVFIGWLIALKRGPRAPSLMAVPAVTMIIAALTIMPIAFVLHGPPKLNLSRLAWEAVIAQGLVSTLLATAAWQFGARRVGAAAAGVFINIEPLLGALLGVLMFGDRMNPGVAVGGAMILVGSVAVVLGEQGGSPSAPDQDLAAPAL